MKAETEISCPECGHEFRPVDRCWYICHQCYRWFGPDEDSSAHKREGECTKRLGSYLRVYSDTDARWQQAIYIERRRGNIPPKGYTPE